MSDVKSPMGNGIGTKVLMEQQVSSDYWHPDVLMLSRPGAQAEHEARAADRSTARQVKSVLAALRAGYSPEISNGLVATMVSVETDAIPIGILYREITMAV